MADSFSDMLLKAGKNTPYPKALSNIILISDILQQNPGMDYSGLTSNYSLYSDEEITGMGLLARIKNKTEIDLAIINVKNFFASSIGTMAYADPGIFGKDAEYREYLGFLREGFEAWADVIAECERFMDKIK